MINPLREDIQEEKGSEILEISRVNFRQRLSRTRRLAFNFMNEKCGLISDSNPCHCSRKTTAMIDDGTIDPSNLLFSGKYLHIVRNVSEEKHQKLSSFLDSRCRRLFREHPFKKSPDFVHSLQKIVSSIEFREIFDFGDIDGTTGRNGG